MQEFLIIRGLPSSGKSTLAKSFGGIQLEADKFFYDDMGNYNFDITKIGDAHKWCFEQFEQAIERGENKIVLSNTSTEDWQFEQYKALAEAKGYRVFVIVVEKRHNGDNGHGVPRNFKLRWDRNLRQSLQTGVKPTFWERLKFFLTGKF